MTVDQVLLTEVLLRDGLQIEPAVVATKDKVRLAERLAAAGVRSMEVGSFVNPEKVPQLADTDDVVRRLGPTLPSVRLHALAFTEGGARRAIAAGARDVRFVVSASEGHSDANTGVGVDAALERVAAAAKILTGDGVRLEGSVATAFVCPFDGETEPARAVHVARRLVEAGARVIHLADTIGAASPWHIRRTVTAVREALPAVPLGLHLHNTYGMASANAWEGIQLGIRRFDAALGGVGGCPFAPGAAGNIATDDLVNLLHQAGIATGVDAEALTAVRRELRILLGHRLESALARVGAAPARYEERR